MFAFINFAARQLLVASAHCRIVFLIGIPDARGLADHFARRVACHPVQLTVVADDYPVFDKGDAKCRSLEHCALFGRGDAHRFSSFLSLGNVIDPGDEETTIGKIHQ